MEISSPSLKWIIRSFIFSFILLGLVGCSSSSSLPVYMRDPTVRNLSKTQQHLLREIERSGIQVIKQGMIFTFVIPTDCFFVKDTRELKAHREKDIDRLSEFLDNYSQYFVSSHIYITGHTDKTWLPRAGNLLSFHYAETIAQYMREDGLDSKIVLVVGEGARNPIASNGYPMGASFNRRVVVMIDGR